MERSVRQLRWRLLIGILLVFWGATSVGAQTNTFPPDGNVGIGTTSPVTTLHILGSNAAVFRVEKAGVEASSYRFDVAAAVSGDNSDLGVVPNTNATGLIFYGRDSAGALQTGIAIQRTGNVGIGTTNPAALLHVAGNTVVDGNIAAKYQDVAEWVPARTALPAGTVVVIDPRNRNHVLTASHAYDTRVAGVISAQPGILLGEAGEDRVKVAHTGRVKVKVDAQYGPIEVGDLLVSSSTPGHAMRSTPVDLSGASIHRPGTIVGKALEPLQEGRGEILVLLTLQ